MKNEVAVNNAIVKAEDIYIPSFDWEIIAEFINIAIETIAEACKEFAPAVKAGCAALWHLFCFVAMELDSLVEVICLYWPDILAEAKTDAIVAYYKIKTLYFRTRRLMRAHVKAVRKAWKAVRKATEDALGIMAEGIHIVAGLVAVMVLAVIKMASLFMNLGAAVAGCVKSGWELRNEIIKESQEA